MPRSSGYIVIGRLEGDDEDSYFWVETATANDAVQHAKTLLREDDLDAREFYLIYLFRAEQAPTLLADPFGWRTEESA